MGFFGFLLGLDMMGHTFNISYKDGKSAYNTVLGTILSISIQVLVLIRCF